MPMYVSLVNWTEKGIGGFQETVNRVDAAIPQMESLGGKLKDVYWTLGPYDIVAVSEFPDDESATAFALKLSSRGSVRTTTLRAFDRDEMSAIIAKTA